jgi:hypothetical protein
MDERDASELIDRVIREAQIRNPREREELRRELESHFAEGNRSESAREAMVRFGNPSRIGAELARVHRVSRFAIYFARLLIAIVASVGAALAIQLVANLRVGSASEALALGPGFRRSTLFSAIIIIVLVAAWELDIESLSCRLERHPVRMLMILLGFAGLMLMVHAAENTILPTPGQAIAASAVIVVIWTCTVAILARTDRIFARVFAPNHK